MQSQAGDEKSIGWEAGTEHQPNCEPWDATPQCALETLAIAELSANRPILCAIGNCCCEAGPPDLRGAQGRTGGDADGGPLPGEVRF